MRIQSNQGRSSQMTREEKLDTNPITRSHGTSTNEGKFTRCRVGVDPLRGGEGGPYASNTVFPQVRKSENANIL